MLVNRILETALGFDKSFIIVEKPNGKHQKIILTRDKKRFNHGNLQNQYYLTENRKRIYVNEIQSVH